MHIQDLGRIAPNAKVIGFTGRLSMDEDENWSKKFWDYAVTDREVGDAARRAADESGIRKQLRVYGDQDVYLHSLEKGIVDIYVFSTPEGKLQCGTWTWPPVFDFWFIYWIDGLDTSRDVEGIINKLKEARMKPRLYKNKSAKHARETLREAEVFFFYGHGRPGRITFHDDDCKYSSIKLQDLEEVEDELGKLRNLKLVVLLGCEVAKDEFDWREAIREWWEKLQRDLERRVTDWWEEQKRRAIEEFLRQLCGAPAGLVIVSSYQFWRWRKRSKERS